MGCTSSRETDTTAPPSRPQTSTSPTTRPFTTNQPVSSSTTALAAPSHRSSTPTTTPHHEILRPLEPWNASTRTWTAAQLSQERQAFFETRVTGRPEIWAAIQSATELLRAGQLENARVVLEAAGVTLPTGSLIDGGYDAWGGLYRLPREVVSDPTNIISLEDEHDGDTIIGSAPLPTSLNAKGKSIAPGDTASPGSDMDERERSTLRDSKGKGKALTPADAVRVKCRLSDRGGPDIIVMLGKTQSVGVLTSRVLEEAGVPSTARIKIAYLGKILDEKETLLASGWKEGHCVNALVVGQA